MVVLRIEKEIDNLLESLKINLKDDNEIIVLTDPSCEMQEVLVNNKVIMTGNYHDFHPDCHGFKFPFRGAMGLAGQIADHILIRKNKKVEIISRKNWKYNK